MAKKSSATPPPTGATGRRATRSKTTEPVAAPAEKRRGRPSKDNAPTATAPPAGKLPRGRKDVVRRDDIDLDAAEAAGDLETVEEGDDAVEVNEKNEGGEHVTIAEAILAQDEAGEEGLPSNRLSSGTGISGSTAAATTFSQEEAVDLTPSEIIDDLPDLASASEKLARFLLPDGANTHPETWKSIDPKRYEKLLQNAKSQKSTFGTQQYISPRTILRALFGTPELELGPWRPDDVLRRVNLVEMLHTLLVTCRPDESDTRYMALQDLDPALPTVIADPEYDSRTLELWGSLAVQLAITRLADYIEHSDEFSPQQVVRDVFYGEDGNFKHEGNASLSPLEDRERVPAFNFVEERYQQILRQLKGDNAAAAKAAVARLKGVFPWDGFIKDVLVYFDARKAQLDEQIAAAGDVAGIAQQLEVEYRQREEVQRSEGLVQNVIATKNIPQKNFRGAISALKQMQQAQAQGNVPPATAPVAQMTAVPTTQRGGRSSAPAKRSLLDPQPDAERLHFESQDPATQVERRQAAIRGQKRSAAVMEEGVEHLVDNDGDDDVHDPTFSPTQDGGFEQDHRDMSAADARRLQLGESSSAPGPPYSSSDGPYPGAPPTYATQAPDYDLNKRPRKNPGTSIPAPPPPPAEGYEHPASTFHRSRAIAARNRAAHRAAPRERQAWSPDEENALVELIVDEGSAGGPTDALSWTVLKDLDNRSPMGARLQNRSAEDMRFKARNMKVTMLLAGAPLPDNWDKVRLDRKAILKLEAAGVQHAQTPVRHRASAVMDE